MNLNNKNRNKLPKQRWIILADFHKRNIFFYDNFVLDLTDFAKVHSGSSRAILNYEKKDIKPLLFTVYPHPKTIVKKLMMYKIGQIEENSYDNLQNNRIVNLLKPKRQNQQIKKKSVIKKVRLSIQQNMSNIIPTGPENDLKVAFQNKQQVHITENKFQKKQSSRLDTDMGDQIHEQKHLILIPSFQVKSILK